MPTKAVEDDGLRIAEVPTQLARLPKHVPQHIRRVLVVSSTADICPLADDLVQEFWSDVKKLLPNTTHVRLHFDLAKRLHFPDPSFDEMAALATLAKLHTVLVEASNGPFHFNVPFPAPRRTLAINELRQRLIIIICKAADGKKIKVIDESTRVEVEACSLLNPIEKALQRVSRATKKGIPYAEDRLKMMKAGLLTMGNQIKLTKNSAGVEHRGRTENAMWDYCAD